MAGLDYRALFEPDAVPARRSEPASRDSAAEPTQSGLAAPEGLASRTPPRGGGLVAWSLVEALPFFLSGRLVAEAIDEGFLADEHRDRLHLARGAGAQRSRRGVGHSPGLPSAGGPGRAVPGRALALTVTGSLHRSTRSGASADTAGVSRLTEQVEIAREAYGSV